MSGTLAIPASAIVSVVPSVISAGGSALELSGLMLTTNPRVPIGTVPSFGNAQDVATYFGSSSQEAALASVYFLGYDNSFAKPANMLFAQYNQSSVGAYLRGGSLSSMSLTALQALSGSLTVTIDGTPHTAGSISLSAATSFSSAAELISVALGVAGPAGAAITAAIASTTLTVSAVSSGTIALGQEVTGAGVTPGTQITAFLTGTGGTGTYTVSISQTVSSESMTTDTPVVTFDSVSSSFVVHSATTGTSSTLTYATGTLASSIGLTQATGAVISAGATTATPTPFMNSVVLSTQNWASFATAFDPDGGSGNTNKLLFAAWTNAQNDRYLYAAWDTDVTATEGAAPTSMGAILKANDSSGTVCIYSPGQGATIATFIMGTVASLDFGRTNGRATAAFRSQTGISADITSESAGDNLKTNGYNYYGAWSTANDRFTFFYDGEISGPFEWIDSYVNQIWLNNQFQLALMGLLVAVGSIPYNQSGYNLIRGALMDPILAGLNFGAFRAGVTLSQSQIANVNNAAGVRIDNILTQQGWFLQVKDASPQVRAARGSPPCTFWYMDGQSVQRITLASVEVQ